MIIRAEIEIMLETARQRRRDERLGTHGYAYWTGQIIILERILED